MVNPRTLYNCLLLAAAAAISACANSSDVPSRAVTAATPNSPPAQGNAYEIGPEDVLEIVVWKEDGLRKEVLVRPDGGISFPLIGEVEAVGKTAGQLQAEITQRLSKFIPRPSVNVSVLKTASYKVYVIGKVNKPGEFTLGRRVDVLQALSMAGGLTPFAAGDDIRILRKRNGKDQTFLFDYAKVQRGTELGQNIELRSGDTVVVP
jgi:polysaccharide biosynthesis/export protein